MAEIRVFNELVESIEFSADREAACSTFDISQQRLDEILNAITWAISNDPLAFQALPNTNVHVAKVRSNKQYPSLFVFYSYDLDAEQAMLLALREN